MFRKRVRRTPYRKRSGMNDTLNEFSTTSLARDRQRWNNPLFRSVDVKEIDLMNRT
jgi:hypothetical protein